MHILFFIISIVLIGNVESIRVTIRRDSTDTYGFTSCSKKRRSMYHRSGDDYGFTSSGLKAEREVPTLNLEPIDPSTQKTGPTIQSESPSSSNLPKKKSGTIKTTAKKLKP